MRDERKNDDMIAILALLVIIIVGAVCAVLLVATTQTIIRIFHVSLILGIITIAILTVVFCLCRLFYVWISDKDACSATIKYKAFAEDYAQNSGKWKLAQCNLAYEYDTAQDPQPVEFSTFSDFVKYRTSSIFRNYVKETKRKKHELKKKEKEERKEEIRNQHKENQKILAKHMQGVNIETPEKDLED